MSQTKLFESKCLCVKSYYVDSFTSGLAIFEEGELYNYYTTNDEFFIDPNGDCGLVILEQDCFKYRFIDMIQYRNLQLEELIN